MSDLLTRLFGLLGDLNGQAPFPLASLERSIAAAHQAHSAARRALGIAMAEEAREAERRAMLANKVTDLEQRAVDAMRGGREDLAMQAAEAIAAMTTDIEASRQASERFAAEVALARREVDAQRRRLSDLDRGRRLARIDAALNAAAPGSQAGLDSFSEAEAALANPCFWSAAAFLPCRLIGGFGPTSPWAWRWWFSPLSRCPKPFATFTRLTG
jgi:hypothetical protein